MNNKKVADYKDNMAGNVIWNSVGSFGYLIAYWLTTVLVLRISGLKVSGIYTLAMTVTNPFATFAIFGMRAFQVSDVTEKYKDREYIASRVITASLAVLGCIVAACIGRYSGIELITILILMSYKIIESFQDVYQAILQKSWRLDLAGKSSVVKGILVLVGFICVLKITNNIGLAVFAIFMAGAICLFGLDRRWAHGFMNLKEKVDKKKVKGLLIECLPLGIFNFLSTYILSLPRIFIKKKLSIKMLGAYGSVSAPVLIIQMLATYIFNPFINVFAEYNVNKDRKSFLALLHKILLVFAGVSVVGIIGAKLVGNTLLILLLGNKIKKYTYLLLPLVGCAISTGVLWFFNMLLTVIRKAKLLLGINIVGICFLYIIEPLFIDKFGVNGASYGLILTLALQSVFMYLVVLKHTKYEEGDSDHNKENVEK